MHGSWRRGSQRLGDVESAVAVAVALVAAGCSPARTAVIVVVESDLAVPAELASVRATVGGTACADASCAHDFVTDVPDAVPLSFAVEPRGEPGAFTLGVAGRNASGATTVERRIEGTFARGRTVLLRVFLGRACAGVPCPATDTCVAGTCVAPTLDVPGLPDVVAGHELDVRTDAGPALDSGTADAPGDAPPFDGDAPRLDASRVFSACAELPGLAPSGVYLLDPDGDGPQAAFEAFCDNESDGGGWTLLAKIDPASTALAYGSPRWTSATPVPFGVPDESLGDALLEPYWALDVTTLRIASDLGGFTASLMAPRAAFRLRDLVDEPEPVRFAADVETLMPWQTAFDGPMGATPCAYAGIDVALPEGGTEIRARIGFVGSSVADCSEPTLWYGAGVSVETTRTLCTATTNTAGAGKVCGGGRRAYPAFVRIYGR